jgi:subtilisin family serine protease
MKKIFFYLIFYGIFINLIINIECLSQERIAGKKVISGQWNNRTVKYIEGEIAIKLKKGFSSDNIKPILQKFKAQIKKEFDELGWGWIEVPKGVDIMPVIDSLKSLPIVETIEPNLVIRIYIEPSDPYFRGTSPATYRHQWALHNIGQNPPSGTVDADIDATEVWDITTGSSNVVISILDSGIPMLNSTLSHPDLNDPNKIILGPDYIYDGEGVRDLLGHGTHVAGIASAETNNDTGVAGVAWNCKLMIIQIFDAYGGGTWEAFYDGVKYAVDYYRNNPQTRMVINISGGDGYSEVGRDAVIYANTYGVTIIAAVGNFCGVPVAYPAAFSSTYSNVIAVSATNHRDSIAEYSNIGPEVNVSAPGGHGTTNYCQSGDLYLDSDDIFSTTPNYQFTLQSIYPEITQEYGYMAGTSMAAPHVAGTAALMLSVNPNLAPSQIREIIQQTADDKGTPGKDDYYGWGRLNANKAVLLALAYINKAFDMNATSLNNQRTLVGEMGSGFHLVFSSGGQIFYRKSNNNGSDWILTKRLSQAENCNYPAITKIGNTLISVWQQQNGSNYDVVFSRSTDNGTNWSTPQALPQSTNIHSLSEGPVLSIVSNTSGKILVVYRQSSDLKFTYSINYGLNWADLGSVPNTGTTSQRPNLTLLSNGDFLLTYDNENSVYTQSYSNTSNTWYGGAIEISNHSNNIHEHRYSQVSAIDGQNYIHAVWQARDTYTPGVNEVIAHRRRSSSGTWSPQTIFRQYGSRLKPTANAHRNTTSGVSIYFQQNIDNPQIRRISSYDGVNWDYDTLGGLGTFMGYGRNVNSLERSYEDNRGIVWTSTNGPVYDVLYDFESEPQRLASNINKSELEASRNEIAGKYTLTNDKGYIYSRRVGVSKGNSNLCFEITEPYFITSDNQKIELQFTSLPESLNEDSLGLNGLLGYLSTVNSTLSSSIDSIVVDVAAYSKNIRDLVNNRFILQAFICDLSSNKTFVIGNLTIESTLPEIRDNKRFSFAIPQIFKGGNVLVGIDAVGLKPNLSNLKYGFTNVYTDVTTSTQRELARKESSKSENLLYNYPNPFNPTTKIKFSTPLRQSLLYNC